MIIQAKGWLSNVVRDTLAEDFDDYDELFDCESKRLMVILSALGCSPVYSLTMSQTKKTN